MSRFISKKRNSYLWAILRFIILIILGSICLFQIVSHLTQGYFLVPPFKLETPVTLETFHSQIKNISMSYPKGWSISNFDDGNHGDKEMIALIQPHYYGYPYITIAYTMMTDTSLEEVAKWGENRIKYTHETFTLDPIDINGRPALLRAYSYTSTLPFINLQKRINCYHTYIVNDHDAYTIEMCVDVENYSKELLSLFEQMIKSISFQ